MHLGIGHELSREPAAASRDPGAEALQTEGGRCVVLSCWFVLRLSGRRDGDYGGIQATTNKQRNQITARKSAGKSRGEVKRMHMGERKGALPRWQSGGPLLRRAPSLRPEGKGATRGERLKGEVSRWRSRNKRPEGGRQLNCFNHKKEAQVAAAEDSR